MHAKPGADTKSGGEGGAACRTMIYILVCARARDSAWGMERGGGGGAACRTMIYILVCARARDSAWGMERGGGGGGGGGGAAIGPRGRQLVPEGGISYEWGGRPPPPPPPPPSLCWIRGCW